MEDFLFDDEVDAFDVRYDNDRPETIYVSRDAEGKEELLTGNGDIVRRIDKDHFIVLKTERLLTRTPDDLITTDVDLELTDIKSDYDDEDDESEDEFEVG